jgi:hypothetical protein
MTFDIRKFLTENKVTAASRELEEGWGIDTDNYTGGVVVQPDYSRSYGPSEPSEAELERRAQEKRKEAEEKLKRDIPDIEDYVYAGLRDKVGAERIMGLVSAKFGPLAVEWLENSGLLDLKENKMSLVSIMKELMKPQSAGPNKPGRDKEEGLEEQGTEFRSAGYMGDSGDYGYGDGTIRTSNNYIVPPSEYQGDMGLVRDFNNFANYKHRGENYKTVVGLSKEYRTGKISKEEFLEKAKNLYGFEPGMGDDLFRKDREEIENKHNLEEKKQAKLNPSAGKRAEQVAQGAYDGRFKNKVIPDKKKQADKDWARK